MPYGFALCPIAHRPTPSAAMFPFLANTRWPHIISVALLAKLASSTSSPNASFPSPQPHADPAVVQQLEDFFAAKNTHNASTWLSQFDPNNAAYYDATLGIGVTPYFTLGGFFVNLTAAWSADAISYPLKVWGDANSAVLYYVDTPGLFGAEIRALSSVTFEGGKVARIVDYWDGAGVSAPVKKLAVPDAAYPFDLGLGAVQQVATGTINSTIHQLGAALSIGDVKGATALFARDATLIDYALQEIQDGQLAIADYLNRSIIAVPWGIGSTVRYVLGGDCGGGYEWETNNTTGVRNGIAALALDADGLVSEFVPMWDGSRLHSNGTV